MNGELPEDGAVDASMRVGRCEAEQDFYAILGISPAAGEATIRRAHRRLALVHHPDRKRAGADVEAQMKRINLAASVLLEPASRARYDHLRGLPRRFVPPAPAPSPARSRSVRPAPPASSSPRIDPAGRFVSPFLGRRGSLRGARLPLHLALFALVTTIAIGCFAQTSDGPVPVASPRYRVPAGPQMASLWAAP